MRLTIAADIYSLGAILYELLTGKPPFSGPTALDILLQVRDKDPTALRQLQPAIDRDLETIGLKCLQKDPDKRYGAAEALANDLERWLAGEPIMARPVGRWERAVKWVRLRPAAAALVGVSALDCGPRCRPHRWHYALAEEQRQTEKALERESQALTSDRRHRVACNTRRIESWRSMRLP